ncbi:TIR domain-containing protein [Polyangium spumosum]|nr:TIR domain-containing protein [Polyangium spumosum]
MPTEYTHFEGAMALAFDKQMLIVKDETVTPRGIAFLGGGHYILSRPSASSPAWLDSEDFQRQFTIWRDAIGRRHHVFFGYSGKATDTANRIIRYLLSIGVAVRDWQTDFRLAGVILDEIEEAAKTCLGGIFLFSKDDELVSGDATHAAPRDNVVFEAGFFMHAVGRERTLIIREEGTKMPADIGGGIYLPLKDRNNTSTIETQLRKFIETRL